MAAGNKAVADISTSEATRQVSSGGRVRWIICGLLFFAATVNYIDRQVIGLLEPILRRPVSQGGLGWSAIDYSNIIFAFTTAYAVGLMVVGRVMDWLGTRKGFSIAVFLWSLAAMAHAGASSVFGFSAARFALGLGESGSFPASIKTVAEWFPKKERAFATGLFNSGTNVGAIVTPIIVPWITYTYGWRAAFVVTGSIGFLWLVLWLAFYRPPEEHKGLTAAELSYIRSDAGESTAHVRWSELVRYKQTWAFAIAKFLTDPIWWLYLYWIPDFLHTRGVDLKGMTLPLLVIYNMATVGSIFGGWFSSKLIRSGLTINRSRKTAMFICAVAVVPIVGASHASNLWTSVLLVSLATAAHQGWSANLFTTASDMFPRKAVGSIVGIGGMAGAVGGMVIAKVVGYVLQWTGSYFPVFLIASSVYLLALAVMQILVPKLEPAALDAGLQNGGQA